MGEILARPDTTFLLRARRSERGSVLLFVLAVLLMLTIAVLGILNMSVNTTKVAVKLEESTNKAHRVDGALESAVNEIREVADPAASDPTTKSGGLSVACFSGPQPFGDFEVECLRDDPPLDPALPATWQTWGAPHRTVELIATDPSNGDQLVGRARVRFADEDNAGGALVGYTVEVCDWLLIQSLSNDMKGCPS